jgi:protein-S-isoprenylcysteine O-methyltransferase Ste14
MDTPNARLTPIVKIGGFSLSGTGAVVAQLALLALIVAGGIYFHPTSSNWPMWVSGTMWIGFIVYWSAAARRAAPSKSSESGASRAVHERLMTFALLMLFVPVPGLGIRFVPAMLAVSLAGLAVQTLALLLAVWARRHLGRNWSAAIAVAVEHQLVRTGPYRVIRHPIYTAVLGMFFGTAIVSGTVHALGGAVVMTLAYARKIRLEEQNLHNEFGPAYDEYRRATWALIPGVM